MAMLVGLASISDHGLKRQVVTQRLLESVIEGRLEEGTRLRVEHLSEQLGVSVTPIRESLVELAGIGMVELRPNRGAMLRPFGPQQLRELYDLRRILESEATRYACGKIPQTALNELSAELSRLAAGRRSAQWLKETRHCDNRLHELIVNYCGNEWLANEIRRYRLLFLALRDVRYRRREERGEYKDMTDNTEHLAIIKALTAKKAEQAATAMGQHLISVTKSLEAEVFPTKKRTAKEKPGKAELVW